MLLESVFGFSEPGGTFSTPNRYPVMLPNEVFALACREYYAEQGLIVDASNGEFAHCPQPERYGDTGHYLLHGHHQHQGLLQSRDIGEYCFFSGYTKKWLIECDYFPENFFDLWDIHDEYATRHSSENAKKVLEKMHKEKNKEGKSVQGVKNGERINKEKNKEGKSVNAMKGAAKINKILHKEKNEEGKSTHAVNMGKKGAVKTNSQVWESTIDGFVSSAGGVASHNRSIGGSGKDKIKLTQQ